MTGLRTLTALMCVILLGSGCADSSSNGPSPGPSEATPPNILLVIMDDVGIDQLQSMGYGGTALPTQTPNIDDIASAGVRFRNTWSMPECSPGRSTLLGGRYPLRNNIFQALGPNDLANSQLSPYALTAPKLLDHAGYQSAMFGKFHLAGPENNVNEYATPLALGWDTFHGWIGGLPASIDTTAGGIAPQGTYTCGYVPRATVAQGAAIGACYTPTASGGTACELLQSQPRGQGDSAGLQCLSRGGILVPDASCQATPPAQPPVDDLTNRRDFPVAVVFHADLDLLQVQRD